jgi:hypothetical protein
MTYPVISLSDGRKIRDEIVANYDKSKKNPYPKKVLDKDFKGLSALIGDAVCIDDREFGDLYAEAEDIRKELLEDGVLASYMSGAVKSPSELSEYLEELLAPRLFSLLDTFPNEALHDPRFWRYLALFPFRWMLCLREPDMQDQDFGGINGKRNYWLLVRAYQWGRKCAETDGSTMAHKIRETRRLHKMSEGYVIDVVHSWIVRTRWCDMSHVAKAFIESITSPKELFNTGTTDDVRPVSILARRVGQVNNNICLNALTQSEAKKVIDAEKLKVISA